MRRMFIPLVISAVMLTAVFIVIERAGGQTLTQPDGWQVLKSETEGDSVREIYAPPGTDTSNAPDIGFIDSPTVTCYQPDASVDACYINWYYISVSASPNYVITMTATINDIGPVAHYQGFFQTSMYAPFNMQDRGIKVKCGALGVGGNPELGNAYAWTIKARDSAGLKSANYGTVYCPSYKQP